MSTAWSKVTPMTKTMLSVLLCAALMAGCNVFDAKYYEALAVEDAGADAGDGGASGDAGTGGSGATGGSGGTGGTGGSGATGGSGGTGGDSGEGGSGGDAGSGGNDEPHLVNTCTRAADLNNIYTLQSSNFYYEVSTEGFSNSISTSAGACTAYATPGVDGFAAIQVEQVGERWHFHVRALNGADPPVQNPVVYMLDSCDARRCLPARSLDLCGDRQDEHFTFEATQAGQWFLGIDDRNPDASGKYEMLVIRTQCGNNVAGEHNEACDDGNFMPGDGCDPECRREIPELNNLEEEFNDDWTTANALLFRTSTQTSVKGRVGGECSFDMFTFVVPPGGGNRDLRILARDRSSTEANPTCDPAAQLGVELFIWGSDGRSKLNATPATLRTGGCPELDPTQDPAVQQLAPGRYFVSLKGDEAAPVPFDYELAVEVL